MPQGPWGTVFAETAPAILRMVLAPVARARVLAVQLEATLLRKALDPNLSRPLLRERVENGATW